MIIKKITIENFLCYYGVKEFELSEGLNIILGENGEGKTKLFEALEWLFRINNEDLESLVSAKALNELSDGEEIHVRVAITTEQFEQKQIISKSFKVIKETGENFNTSNLTLEGVEENRIGERTPTDGRRLLDRIFPPVIRKYSMFKGESELDIFKNTEALEILINNFSQAAKFYDKYSAIGDYLLNRAEKAVIESAKLDKKKADKYKAIQYEIEHLQRLKDQVKVKINHAEREIEKLNELISEAGKYVSNAEALKTLNDRIDRINQKIRETNARINENYTEGLFDEKWILVNFESFQKEFTEKINALSLERRRLQSEFDKEKGKKEGEQKLKDELLKNAIPLPVTVPSQAVMKEMLDAELCKVCNREAKIGSEAYEFMMNRLKNFLSSQEVKESEEEERKEIFENDYTSRLVVLSTNYENSLKGLRSIKKEIKEIFEFNSQQKQDGADLERSLENEKEERNQILGDSKLKENDLITVIKNYPSWQEDLARNKEIKVKEEAVILDYELKLKAIVEEKDKIDLESANAFLVNTREVLRDIEEIFVETKEQKFNEFIDILQDKSNEIFDRINIESFTGTIVFVRRKIGDKVKIEVELTESNGNVFRPGMALNTSMHISILFAISELATAAREEKYPLIFDAPTSSFGENKTTKFLNLIYETGNQKILLLKDFLATDPTTGTLNIKKDFADVKRDKAFWIRLQRPFDKKNLKTLNTEVISL